MLRKESRFFKKIGVSVAIIIAALIAMSVSTWALFSETVSFQQNELEASKYSVDIEVKKGEEIIEKSTPNSNKKYISSYILDNIVPEKTEKTEETEEAEESAGTNGEPNTEGATIEYIVKLKPQGTIGETGYCKITLENGESSKEYFVKDLRVSEDDSTTTFTFNVKVPTDTNVTMTIAYSWASCSVEGDNIITENSTIAVEKSALLTKKSSADSSEGGDTTPKANSSEDDETTPENDSKEDGENTTEPDSNEGGETTPENESEEDGESLPEDESDESEESESATGADQEEGDEPTTGSDQTDSDSQTS